jgi:hypothetical protein
MPLVSINYQHSEIGPQGEYERLVGDDYMLDSSQRAISWIHTVRTRTIGEVYQRGDKRCGYFMRIEHEDGRQLLMLSFGHGFRMAEPVPARLDLTPGQKLAAFARRPKNAFDRRFRKIIPRVIKTPHLQLMEENHKATSLLGVLDNIANNPAENDVGLPLP